ncbi:hypothetical protein DL769_005892 [Monosporascus sp. CRB-8-3]|nr:hypothetical protein DL769_005892 [Monosporascus sp. CRB-8-3]
MGSNQARPTDVSDGIIEDMNTKTKTRSPTSSVHDLALLIMSRCSGAFDRYRLSDQNYQFLEMLGCSVGSIAHDESRLSLPRQTALAKEVSLLTEIKDIKDELSTIDVIFDSQLSVLTNFKALLHLEHYDNRIAAEIHKRLEVHRKDIKRNHSNALEARFTGDQAAVTAKQGQTILVFTIVTIIFLAMSSIAIFFSISIEQWDGVLTVGYVSKYMLGIGLGISIPLIAMAFTLTEISDATSDALSAARRRLFGGLRRRPGADDDSSDILCLGKELDARKSGREWSEYSSLIAYPSNAHISKLI